MVLIVLNGSEVPFREYTLLADLLPSIDTIILLCPLLLASLILPLLSVAVSQGILFCSEEASTFSRLQRCTIVSLPCVLILRYRGSYSDSKESACSAGNLVQSLGGEDPLEKEMATHSCILVWRILWTEEPCRHSPWGHKESDTTETDPFTFICQWKY